MPFRQMRQLILGLLCATALTADAYADDNQAQASAASAPNAESVAVNAPFGSTSPDWLNFMNGNSPWQTWLVVPVITRHFNRQAVVEDNLSEDNPGFGVERSNGTWALLAGAYRNSIRQDSVYAMVGYMPLQLDLPFDSRLSIGGVAGLLTGYQNTQKGYPIVPAGGGFISWEITRHIGIDVFLVPTLKSFQVEGFAAAQIKIGF